MSIMWANNETGVLFPIEIAAICRSHGVLFHTDAVQVAEVFIDVRELGVDFLSLSAQAACAKGIGVLYVKTGVPFQPYIVGGGQERGQGGTGSVANIVAFGRARIGPKPSRRRKHSRGALRDKLENGFSRPSRDLSETGEGSRGCRTQQTSGSTASRLRRRCCCWIAKVSAPRAVPPAPVPSSHPTYSLR